MSTKAKKRRRKQPSDLGSEQARLQAAAAKCFGIISGGDPLASEKVRETVRERLLERLRQGRV